jgi:pimeloyl-ACP methyl ester carboxylesterase
MALNCDRWIGAPGADSDIRRKRGPVMISIRTFALVGALLVSACSSHEKVPHEHAPSARAIAEIEAINIAVDGPDYTSVKAFRRPAAARTEPRRIIIIPGTPSDVDYWGGAMALIDPSYEVIAIERPGYNGSGPKRAVTDLDEQATIIGPLVEGYDGEIVLIGHSFGASVALAALRRYGPHIDGLILVSPYVVPVDGRRRFWLTAAAWTPLRFIGGSKTDRFFSEISAQRRQSRALLAVAAQSCRPMLIVQGEMDDLVPQSDVEKLKALVPPCAGAQIATIAGGDHYLSVHAAHALSRSVNSFLVKLQVDLFRC